MLLFNLIPYAYKHNTQRYTCAHYCTTVTVLFNKKHADVSAADGNRNLQYLQCLNIHQENNEVRFIYTVKKSQQQLYQATFHTESRSRTYSLIYRDPIFSMSKHLATAERET